MYGGVIVMGECDLCGHYHELIEGVCAECRRKYYGE